MSMAKVSYDEKCGVWWCRLNMGRSAATGRAIRPYRRFPEAATREQAQDAADAWERLMRSNDLGSLLMAYADEVEAMGAPSSRHGARAATAASYRAEARRVAAMMPGKAASEVRPRDLTALYRRMMAPRPKGLGLSPSTAAHAHWFLSGAFKWMVDRGAVESSPVPQAMHPAPGRPDSRPFGADHLAVLVPALEARSREAGLDGEAAFAALVTLATGARVGEVCALRVCDWRPAVPDVAICGTMTTAGGLRRQPETKGGKDRRVTVAREDSDAVALHVAAHAALGLPTGPEAPLVTVDGRFCDPGKVSASFKALCKELGLPKWARYHTLRHTHATQLLVEGIPMGEVSERMGHADVATTIRNYEGWLPGRDAASASAMARVMERARKGAA